METTDDFLYRQLDGLGQMIADGLADEPDGKWIRTEYRRICRSLGLLKYKKRHNNVQQINEFMTERIKTAKCHYCEGMLQQTRSGSLTAICKTCNRKFVLGKRKTQKK